MIVIMLWLLITVVLPPADYTRINRRNIYCGKSSYHLQTVQQRSIIWSITLSAMNCEIWDDPSMRSCTRVRCTLH